jgi:hypothetical protein
MPIISDSYNSDNSYKQYYRRRFNYYYNNDFWE